MNFCRFCFKILVKTIRQYHLNHPLLNILIEVKRCAVEGGEGIQIPCLIQTLRGELWL